MISRAAPTVNARGNTVDRRGRARIDSVATPRERPYSARMRRPRCPFCQRPVGRLWLRCRVCRSRLAPWYILALIVTLAALSLVGLFIFRETTGRFPF